MIQIDIDMPKSCFQCDKTYKWKKDGEVKCPHINMPSISTNRNCRPPYCPLKEVPDNSVLEDIKVELLNKSFSITNPKNTYEYINVASLADIESVIDKYMKKWG